MRRFVSNWTRSVRHHSPRTFGVMRATIRHGLRIVLAATILVAGVVYLGRDALRVRYHLWALRGDEQRTFAPVKSPVTRIKRGLATVAGKPGDDLAPGTQNSILKQAGLK